MVHNLIMDSRSWRWSISFSSPIQVHPATNASPRATRGSHHIDALAAAGGHGHCKSQYSKNRFLRPGAYVNIHQAGICSPNSNCLGGVQMGNKVDARRSDHIELSLWHSLTLPRTGRCIRYARHQPKTWSSYLVIKLGECRWSLIGPSPEVRGPMSTKRPSPATILGMNSARSTWTHIRQQLDMKKQYQGWVSHVTKRRARHATVSRLESSRKYVGPCCNTQELGMRQYYGLNPVRSTWAHVAVLRHATVNAAPWAHA